MKRHPDDRSLLAYSTKEDTVEARSSVGEHLAQGCGACLEKVRTYEALLARFDVPPLEEVPDRWIEEALVRLRRLDQQEAPTGRGVSRSVESVISKVVGALEEIRLRVLFDSAATPAAVGIRGATGMKGRQFLLDSEVGRIHLEICRVEAGKSQIRGQFLPAGPSKIGAAVAVLVHDGRSTRRKISKAGDFEFTTTASGEITVHIEWRGKLLSTDPVDISSD